MSDRSLRIALLVVDVSSVIKRVGQYQAILPILTDIPLNDIIEAMLAVSVNHQPGKLIETNPRYQQTIRDDNDLIWYLLENKLGERFETIPINDLEVELDNLLCELDERIGRALPSEWGPGEYTFYGWLGPGQMVVMRDR